MLNVKEFKEVLKQIKLDRCEKDKENGKKLLESINKYLLLGSTDICCYDLKYLVNKGVVDSIRSEMNRHGFAVWFVLHMGYSYVRVKPLEDMLWLTRWMYKLKHGL